MLTVLVKPIFFYTVDGKAVSLKRGSRVILDPNSQIGFYEGLHFDLMDGEYMVVQ